jgi:hypothetical protein
MEGAIQAFLNPMELTGDHIRENLAKVIQLLNSLDKTIQMFNIFTILESPNIYTMNSMIFGNPKF